MTQGLNLIDEMRSLMDHHVLDTAVKRIETELKGEPLLAADLYQAIGPAYASGESALVCQQRAVELSERARGPDDPATLGAEVTLGMQYGWMEENAQGEKILREVIASSRRVLGEDSPVTIQAIYGWSYQHRGQGWATLNDPTRRPLRSPWSAGAVSLLREALERSRRVLGNDDPRTLNAASVLALALGEEGSYAEAEALIRETIGRSARVLGENDSQTLDTQITLAAVLYYSGRVEDAIALGQELRERFQRAYGENDPLALVVTLKLGVLQLEIGRIDEAEPLLRDAARRLPLIVGGNDQYTQECRQALARLDRLKKQSR